MSGKGMFEPIKGMFPKYQDVHRFAAVSGGDYNVA